MKEPDTLEKGRMWLRTRSLRRKLMAAVLILLLVAIVLGTWVIDGWLSSSVARFSIFWGVVTLYTLLLLLLTVYDMLRVRGGG